MGRETSVNNIICIAGPTASGKTALAVELAKERNAEVISCDSMQVYRRMDIGTAKPTVEEMQGIVHHMIDVADPNEDFSVSRYCDMATPILDDILARGKNAIVVGGTGLYMDSLIRGNDFAPYPATGARQRLEAQADALGMEHMLARLRAIDPEAAARLHLADRKRILRALEVFEETGETISAHNARTRAVPPRYTALWLGLDFTPRELLYARIDRRVSAMLAQGLESEIRRLLADGTSEKCTAMQAIGYKEFVTAIQTGGSIEAAAEDVRKASRHYAKRQLTWFRRNEAMHWLTRTADDRFEEILHAARQVLANFDK